VFEKVNAVRAGIKSKLALGGALAKEVDQESCSDLVMDAMIHVDRSYESNCGESEQVGSKGRRSCWKCLGPL